MHQLTPTLAESRRHEVAAQAAHARLARQARAARRVRAAGGQLARVVRLPRGSTRTATSSASTSAA
jgi:hypothetical protein